MTFTQRLGAEFYARVHQDIRARMAETGVDLLLLDSNDDVIYTTGFSHYTTERPVVFAITQERTWLLLPRLEETHAAHQIIAAEPVIYFEFPGVDRPFDVLARALPRQTGTVAHSYGIAFGRIAQIQNAFPDATVKPSSIVQQMRLRKYPEEIVLHREAARISDAMVEAGVALIAGAMRRGGELPTEIEIESHVSRHAMNIMYGEHQELMLVQGRRSRILAPLHRILVLVQGRRSQILALLLRHRILVLVQGRQTRQVDQIEEPHRSLVLEPAKGPAAGVQFSPLALAGEGRLRLHRIAS